MPRLSAPTHPVSASLRTASGRKARKKNGRHAARNGHAGPGDDRELDRRELLAFLAPSAARLQRALAR